jgi:hypothetical protein
MTRCIYCHAECRYAECRGSLVEVPLPKLDRKIILKSFAILILLPAAVVVMKFYLAVFCTFSVAKKYSLTTFALTVLNEALSPTRW